MRRPFGLALWGAMRFGAIDLGSNSVRCLAVRVRGGVLEYIDSGAWITRLTEGIGGGAVSVGDKPLGRTLDAVGEALLLLGRSGVPLGHVAFRATESEERDEQGQIIRAMEELTGSTWRCWTPPTSPAGVDGGVAGDGRGGDGLRPRRRQSGCGDRRSDLYLSPGRRQDDLPFRRGPGSGDGRNAARRRGQL